MKKILASVIITFFLNSCGLLPYGQSLLRSIKRTLFPSDCRIEVKLDTTNLMYVDDLWDYRFFISEQTDLFEFADAVKFTPKVEFSKEGYGSWTSDQFSLDLWNILPDTEYEIQVSKFYSNNDCFLKDTVSFKIPKLKRKPSFYVYRENVFESNLNKVLPVGISNIQEFNIRYAELSVSQVVSAVASLGNRYYEQKNSVNWKSTKWKAGQKVNSLNSQGIDLDSYFGSKPNTKSWIAFELGATVIGDENKEIYKQESLFLQSTDLGITTKSDNQYLYVWINSLSKAEPKQNVSVTLYERGANRGNCRTDTDGFCQLPAISDKNSFDKSVLVAEEDSGDKSFLHFNETHIEGYSDYYQNSSVQGKIYFDRKLYRPGDRVEIKTFLGERRNGSFYPYAGKSATIKIMDSTGKELFNSNSSTTSQGGVSTSFSIPSDAPLGHYSVSIYTPGQSYSSSYDTFQVEEFRPVNFLVNLKLADSVSKDENIKGNVEGKYLFGAPMGGSKLSYSVLKRNRSIYFDSFPDFNFSEGYSDYYDEYNSDSSDYVTGNEATLDSKGQFSLDIPLKALKTKYSTDDEDIETAKLYNLSVEASVYDVDGKSVTKTTSIPYFPSNHLVGVKCDDRYKSLDKPFEFEILTVNKNGKLEPGKDVKVYVIYNDWVSVLSKGIGKFFFRENQVKKKIVETKKLTTANSAIKFNYKASDPGSYSILVINKDQVYSKLDFYAYEKESYYTWDFRGDDSIELRSDKSEYNIGDKAKVLIKSPLQNARAIVTVERDGVYFKKSFLMKGNSAPIEIPIEDKYLPNVDVNVVLLSGRQSLPAGASSEDIKEFNERDLGAPKAKTGSVQLKVNLKTKSAEVLVSTDKTEYQPRETVQLKIKTLPGSEVTVSVADRGVLDLVGYSFTSPVSVFYHYWHNIVKTFELRSMIIKHYAYENKGDSPGGDYGEESGGGFGMDSESGTRKDFKFTAFWNPTLIADSNGEVNVSFVLPDNLTTFRTMVAISNNGRYGTNNSEFLVKKSLVLQKTVVRFVRIGDSLELGGSITNNTQKKGKFKYKIESKSLSKKEETGVLELNAGQTKEVLTNFTLSEKDYYRLRKETPKGELNLSYKLSVEPESMDSFPGQKKADLSDALQVSFPVKEFDPITAVRISGYTDSEFKSSLKFPKKESVLLNRGSLDIRLAGTALTGLKNAFDFYESNPYFCMEQRTSAYLLSISAGSLLKEFLYKEPNKDSYDFTQIEKLFLDEMDDFQGSDGSFYTWKSKYGRSGYAYLTAYVSYVMILGKEKGKRVNQRALNKAISFLESYVKNPNEPKTASWQTLSLIYAVLSKEKKNVSLLEKSLVDNFKELNPKSQGIFLLAYAEQNLLESKESNSTFQKLFNQYQDQILWEKDSIAVKWKETEEHYYSYYNVASVVSYYLRLLVKLEPNNPKIPELVNLLLIEKSLHYWGDSQGVGNLAFALSEYRNRFEATDSSTDVELLFGGDSILRESFSSNSDSILKKEFSFETLFAGGDPSSKPLSIKRVSDAGRVYYQSRVLYVPIKDEVKEKSNDLEISKTIYRLDGRNSDGSLALKEVNNMTRGSSYLVKLSVLADKPRPFIMVEDPIPSNTEIINSSFLTEKSSEAEATDTDSGYYGSMVEYRDDRVLFSRDYIGKGKTEFSYLLRPIAKGVVASPAAKTFLMYHPNVNANTSSKTMKVE